MTSSDQTLGQIKIFPYNFAPTGWLQCDGQVLPISQNQTLFDVIGTTYGGDGKTTFALPDLRSLCVLGVGQGTGSAYDYTLGQTGGEYFVALTAAQNGIHSHNLLAVPAVAGVATTGTPSPSVALARSVNAKAYAPAGPGVTMDPSAITSSSNSTSVAAHGNIMPLLGLNFCICILEIG
jgi:microcystin-dependent protein